ncbi:hypothetical protein G8F28_004267 [Salmonella enterica]|nr:hypothetical protein [Salmonella enterica]MEN30533.1 hypothetical protein [Salmonella enterica]
METILSGIDKTVLDIDKIRGALKSDFETVLASLSKEEYKAAMKALSNGKFSMEIPSAPFFNKTNGEQL